MKNTIYHVCPYCFYTITSTYEKEEDYCRVIARGWKALDEHMTNSHNDRYKETKRNRSEYGEDDTGTAF